LGFNICDLTTVLSTTGTQLFESVIGEIRKEIINRRKGMGAFGLIHKTETVLFDELVKSSGPILHKPYTDHY